MSGSTELTRELLAIINSPYPVSLDKLANICLRADVLTVRTCMRQLAPCAIRKLTADLSDALPLWQCCIPILESLSQSSEFRNELLIRNPNLLNALLTKANSSQYDFDEYTRLCVALLSQPLPEGLPLPASIQPFFLRVCQEASQKPDVQTLKPIYYMLNGACRGLLAQLSPDASQLFDTQLCQILTSNGAGKNSMLLLWCFGVVILAEHAELVDLVENSDRDISDHAANSVSTAQWTTASGRKMFGTKNGCHKTITLTCFSVLWAIKGGVGVPDDEAIEGIKIATRTLRLVGPQILEQWLVSDGNGITRNLLPKLLEKLQREDINSFIQLEALNFYATIGGPDKLCIKTSALYEAALMKMDGCGDSVTLKSLLSSSLPLFANHFQEQSLRSLLYKVLQSNSSPKSTGQMLEITSLVEELRRMVLQYRQLRANLLAALSHFEMQESIQSFLATSADDVTDGKASLCRTHETMIRHSLLSATTSMLLTAVLASESRSALPLSFSIALVEKQRQLPKPSTQCSHAETRPTSAPVSLFQQACTPVTGLPLQDWRSRLQADMESQAVYQRETIIRSITQICHDLENRCDTVEEPLRCERERADRLQLETAQLRANVESLEQKRVDDNLFLGTLESEKIRLENENDQLSTRIEHLQDEVEKANSQAENMLYEAEESHNHKEMQLNSTILQHEETIRVCQEDLQALRKENTSLNDDLRKEEQDGRDLIEQYNNLQTRFEKLETEIEEQKEVADRLSTLCDGLQEQLRDTELELNQERQISSGNAEEILRLGTEASTTKEDLRQSRDEQSRTIDKLNDLQSRYIELAESSTKALQEAEADHENKLEAAASAAAHEYDLLKEDLQMAERERSRFNELLEQTKQDLQIAEASVPPLQGQIQALTEDCVAKEAELEGLRSWKNRVFASMGLPPEVHTSPRTPRHVQQVPPSNLATQSRSVAFTGTTPMQHTNYTAKESEQATSFSGDGSQVSRRHSSTAKRPRTRDSEPVEKTRSQPKGSSTSSRPALRPRSPNRRHTVLGTAILESTQAGGSIGRPSLPAGKNIRSLEGSQQEEPDTEFFSSTPFSPGNMTSGAGGWFADDGSMSEL